MDLSVVKQEVAKGGKIYKAFEKADEILTTLESLESYERELTNGIKAKKAELAGIEEATEKAAGRLEDARAQAKLLSAAAEKEALKIVKNAESNAAGIVDAARDEAKEYQAILSDKKVERDVLLKEVGDLQKQKRELEEYIDKIKKSFGN